MREKGKVNEVNERKGRQKTGEGRWGEQGCGRKEMEKKMRM